MSIPCAQRNFKRAVLASPLKEHFKQAERYPWIRMSVHPVKRSFKKMDGRMRILKHI